jgi:hypothetical protein
MESFLSPRCFFSSTVKFTQLVLTVRLGLFPPAGQQGTCSSCCSSVAWAISTGWENSKSGWRNGAQLGSTSMEGSPPRPSPFPGRPSCCGRTRPPEQPSRSFRSLSCNLRSSGEGFEQPSRSFRSPRLQSEMQRRLQHSFG